MRLPVNEIATRLQAQAGWSDVVDSLKGAIDDRSHVMVLGVAAVVLFTVWVNWKLAKWLISNSRPRS